MPTSKIETELVEAVEGFKAKAKEDRQEYLTRLIVAVQKLDDDEWEKISSKAQKWHVAGAKADNDEKPIPEFPDLVDDDEAEEETPKKSRAKAAKDEEDDAGDTAGGETDDEEEDDDVKTTAKKKAPAKKAAAEKEAPAKKKALAAEKEAAPAKKKAADEKPAKSGKVEGIKVDIKKMVIKKPSITAEEIYEALGGKKAELSKVTISAVRSETRHTLRVLNDMGKLDIKV